MYATDVAVIGAGQAGLAMSCCLSSLGIDHVVLERRQVGARWVSNAWDSLRLLTPNWLNGLPGSPYRGDDPDGFMPRDQFIARLQSYATSFSAPVVTQAEVLSLVHECGGFLVSTSRGSWRARAVVVATGQCDLPQVPAFAGSIGRRVLGLHSSQYRSPLGIPDGGVLVVGASASGVQIADELQRSGRQVTLAVGQHARAPRNWRGQDIFWWMHRTGMLAERTRELPDAEAARRQPALQLAGRTDRSNVDLVSLQALGVRLAGRLMTAEDSRFSFADDLGPTTAAADAKLERLLARIDGIAGPRGPHETIASVDLSHETPRRLSAADDNVRTVVWATGYRRAFPWINIPDAIAPEGDIAHVDGITRIPGLYALGFRLLRKRDSHFIGGVGSDAIDLAQHIMGSLRQSSERAA